MLIAHSMGGLIARVATKLLPTRTVRKLILLGTPNHGIVCPGASAARHLPLREETGTARSAPYARATRAKSVWHLPGDLPVVAADEAGIESRLARCSLLAARRPQARRGIARTGGRGSRAAGGAGRTHGAYRRRQPRNGGRGAPHGHRLRIPLERKRRWHGPRGYGVVAPPQGYFIDEAHGNLANNTQVIGAILDLLRHGRTRALERRFVPKRGRLARIDEARLRSTGRERSTGGASIRRSVKRLLWSWMRPRTSARRRCRTRRLSLAPPPQRPRF